MKNLARISVLAGFDGQNTKYQQNIVSQNQPSGLIAANLQFFRFNKTNGNLTAVFLPVIPQPDRVKFNMNATYHVKLTGNLSWNISFYGDWITAAGWSVQQRLRLQLGTKPDIWQQVT